MAAEYRSESEGMAGLGVCVCEWVGCGSGAELPSWEELLGAPAVGEAVQHPGCAVSLLLSLLP